MRVALLVVAGVVSAAVSCSNDSPQATGTKTDWLIACDAEADCNTELDLSCLCGLCTKTCTSAGDCEEGVCGSVIATTAACGNESEFALAGEQLCLPHQAEECVEATLSAGTALGEAAPVSCSVAGALICEDFEGPLPQGYTTWGSGESSAGLQECQARGGSGSLRIATVDDAYTQTRMRLPMPVASGALHARFYLRLEEGSVLPEQLILFEFWDQDEGQIDDRTTLYLNADEQLEIYLGSAPQTLQAVASAPLAQGVWHCVELGMELSDTGGTVVMNVEGAPMIEVTDVDTLPSDPVSVAVLEGVPSEGSQGTTATFFVDDLVVATEPVGCD